jgi:hypothetical protein
MSSEATALPTHEVVTGAGGVISVERFGMGDLAGRMTHVDCGKQVNVAYPDPRRVQWHADVHVCAALDGHWTQLELSRVARFGPCPPRTQSV